VWWAITPSHRRHEDASVGVRAGLPRYPIPATLFTRLGVDKTEQGQGLGRALVVDAIRRVIAAADTIGAVALLIHAENPAARVFYLHLAEFEASPTDPLHLMLRLESLRATLAGQ
jgi:GNAT superfamily N-acetyltransferase